MDFIRLLKLFNLSIFAKKLACSEKRSESIKWRNCCYKPTNYKGTCLLNDYVDTSVKSYTKANNMNMFSLQEVRKQLAKVTLK